MPEGPEIRRAADTLAKAVAGVPVEQAWFAKPELKPYQEILSGCLVESIQPRGKALLTQFAGGLTLYTHNQLYGVWKIARPGKRPPSKRSLRVALDTSRASILLYSASDVAMWPTDQVHEHPLLQRLGPDILSREVGTASVVERLTSKRFRGRSLAALLLDQSFLAGMGNYLRSEVLFHAGIAPQRRPAELATKELENLAEAALSVPRRSYRSRGISRASGMREDYLDASSDAFSFFVFDRAGEPCLHCHAVIERVELSGRRLYLCRQCQR